MVGKQLINNILNISLYFFYLFKYRIHLKFDEVFVNFLMVERGRMVGKYFQK